MGSKTAQPQKISSAPRSERRMSTPSDPGSPPHVGETTEMRERRRKQNRIAQQAFRARQKVRVEALESEWQQLRNLHEALNQACHQRAKDIDQLNSRVDHLMQDIEFVKTSQELDKGSGWQSPASSSASSSYGSYERRYPQSQPRHMVPPGYEPVNFFDEGGITEFPDFPLDEAWFQANMK